MLKFKNKAIGLSLVAVATLFIGCGSSSDDNSSSSVSVSTTDGSVRGQLIDDYIQGAQYKCADGKEDSTDLNGYFSCESLPVTFSIGGLELGTLDKITSDNHVFPQDLLGVSRDDIDNEKVIAMAQLLQSLDKDENPENGIEIDKDAVSNITHGKFSHEKLDLYINEAKVKEVNKDDAIKHLKQNQHQVQEVAQTNLPSNVTDSLNSVKSTLSDEVKDTITYMSNEERLAYDVYTKLYSYHPDVEQLKNIASNAETQHVAAVNALASKYQLNNDSNSSSSSSDSSSSTETTDMTTEYSTSTSRSRMGMPSSSPASGFVDADLETVSGVYPITELQNLYNTLVDKGMKSKEDALQVGCMVEVTDITDLDKDIDIAKKSNAEDVVATFNFLRDGSYRHYWSFDQGLKSMGIANGCCSLGDEYCKTESEYPKTEQGNSNNNSSDDSSDDSSSDSDSDQEES